MNALIAFLRNRSKLARLKAEAKRTDEEFEKKERHASAELHAIRMRNAISSSKATLSRFSIEAPAKVEAPDPFVPSKVCA